MPPTTDQNTPTVTPPQGAEQPQVPPTPSPKPGRRKVFLIIGIVVILLVALVFVFKALTAPVKQTVRSATDTTTNSSSSSSTQAVKIPKWPAGYPALCGNSTALCVPNVAIDKDVVPKLEKIGFTCKPSEDWVESCISNADSETKINFDSADADLKEMYVNDVDAEAGTSAVGTNPGDKSGQAWAKNVSNFEAMVAVIFAQYPSVQKDLDKWVTVTQTGACNYKSTEDHDTVDEYQVRCDVATPITVSGSAGTVTSWTSIINLSTPLVGDVAQ